MRRIFEWIGGFALIAFSFYFTDKVSMLVADKSDLMQEIKAVSSLYEEPAIDAVIDTDNKTIVPGRFGKSVNSKESYLEMHDFGSFNENYLVYDYIKPDKSLEDNKNLFITKGNSASRKVSFIINDNSKVSEYFTASNFPYNKALKSLTSLNDNVEIINGGITKEEFKALNDSLKGNPKICLKDFSNIELCKKNNYYLISPGILLNSSNFIDIKNNIEPGSIILINSTAKIEDVKLLIKEIEYKDLEIVPISKLIAEKEN